MLMEEDDYVNGFENDMNFQDIELGTNSKKKIHSKLSVNLEYISQRATSSMFVSKLLNDENDNIINDQNTYDKLIQIIENIKKDTENICDTNTNTRINLYDLGYNMGLMKEMLPDNYNNLVLKIRGGIMKKDWKSVKIYTDKLMSDLLSNE